MPTPAKPHSQVYGPQAPTADDDHVQEAVLGHLIYLYPAQLTIAEVVREMSVASTTFTVVDQYERALRDLIRAGLVHRNGEFVFASRAAVQGEAIRL